ncbi:hypothetical protein DLAC_01471 [Tieghemostelium lacteum]|uniref:Uncharacterized protein n=1 Tax=Tieghemostelium lacteum TaxID=361077 RepID=A0A152A5V0_TIELA|nr:hypothetical protein DLAC_01471 [Tieghemostelium lacteum]|eukprot:KYR01485.1 hypothetical protein DLAC_01471 [Tieghemostelium lacteum]
MGDNNKSTFVPEWQHNNNNTNNRYTKDNTHSNRGGESTLKRKTSFAVTPTFVSSNSSKESQTKDNSSGSSVLADTSVPPKLNRSKSSPQIDIVLQETSHKERSFSPSPILPTTFDNNKTFVIPRYNINNNSNINNNQHNNNIIINNNTSNYNTYHHNSKFKPKPQLVSFKSQPNLNSLDKNNTNSICNNSNHQNHNHYSSTNRYNSNLPNNDILIIPFDPLTSSSTMSLTSSTSSLSSSSSSTLSISSSSHNFVNNQDFFVCDSIIEEDHQYNNNNNFQDISSEFPPLSSTQISKPKGRSTPTLSSGVINNNNNNNLYNNISSSITTNSNLSQSISLPIQSPTISSQQQQQQEKSQTMATSPSLSLNIQHLNLSTLQPTLASMISLSPQVPSSPTSSQEDTNTSLELEKVKVLVPVKMASSAGSSGGPSSSSSSKSLRSGGVGSSTPSSASTSSSSSTGLVANSQGSLISSLNQLKKNNQLSVSQQQKSTMKASPTLPKDPKTAFRKTFSEPNLAGIPTKDGGSSAGGAGSSSNSDSPHYTPSRKGLTDPTRKIKVPKPDKLLGNKNKNSFFEVIMKREEAIKKLQNDGCSQEEIDAFLDSHSEYTIPESGKNSSSVSTPPLPQTKPSSILKSSLTPATTTAPTTPVSTVMPLKPIIKNSSNYTPPTNTANTGATAKLSSKLEKEIVLLSSPTSLSPISSPSLNKITSTTSIKTVSSTKMDVLELEPTSKSANISQDLSDDQVHSEETDEDEEHEEQTFLKGLGWVPHDDSPSIDEINEISLIIKKKVTIVNK